MAADSSSSGPPKKVGATTKSSSFVKDAYLILYNSACCVGWALVLGLSLLHLSSTFGSDPTLSSLNQGLATIYEANNLALILTYVQSAALLEIVHAAIKLVKSPAIVTAMQVSSRIMAILALNFSPLAQAQWGAGVMIISWAMVEVPRYAFYVMGIVTGDANKKTPFVLFWLRYSLFAILYPTGIVGELTVFIGAARDDNLGSELASFVFGTLIPIIYFFGSPFMIFNMASNRKRSFKKRFAKPPPPPRGLVFPLDGKGTRSSTPVNKAILEAAVRAASPEKATSIANAKGWRFGYVKHLVGMVQEQCKSPEAALAVAEAGLAKAYEIFEFISQDGNTTTSFAKAMAAVKEGKQFSTGFIKGQGVREGKPILEVPYKNQTLSGEALKNQVKKWVDYGTIEPSAGEAIVACVDNPNYLDLSDKYFVLLGAGSAMGPFLVLMALGANVIAIDLDRSRIWKRLVDIAKKSSGSITFPLSKPQSECKTDDELFEAAGCNLFTQTPMIRDWLLDLYPGKSFTVGSYAYLDGALHVQVSLAMDAICKDLSEKRKGTSLAYLCTPTDLHMIPKEANDAAEANFKEYMKKPFCQIMRLLSNGKLLRKNAKSPVRGNDGTDFYYVNGISVAQGPNYALAKRMQHWRAIVARERAGCIVSSNIAPATSTVSVVHNRTFAWAYEGMPYFKPYEIFAPETSNAVMSAILLYDLSSPSSASNPRMTKLTNPNDLFKWGSFHGGNWRCAFAVDSIGESSVLIYFARIGFPYICAGLAVSTAVAAKYFGAF